MIDSSGEPRVLFVLGTGRCGSTIVQEMLCRHPGVAFVSNVDDALSPLGLRGGWNSALYRKAPVRFSQRDRLVPNLIQTRLHFGPSEGYRLLEREVSALVSRPCRDITEEDVTPWLRDRLRAFVHDRVTAQRKEAFLHKFTGWPRARFLHAVLPEARFVHVIRDGRAVAASIMQRPWWRGYLGPERWGLGPLPGAYAEPWARSGRSFVALAGIEWMMLMDAFSEARVRIPADRWMDLRYEDFVDEPRRHVERMLDWVGLPWTDEFEATFARYSYHRGRKQAFRHDLTPAQQALLDDLLGGHLSALGYGAEDAGPAAPAPPVPSAREASG